MELRGSKVSETPEHKGRYHDDLSCSLLLPTLVVRVNPDLRELTLRVRPGIIIGYLDALDDRSVHMLAQLVYKFCVHLLSDWNHDNSLELQWPFVILKQLTLRPYSIQA